MKLLKTKRADKEMMKAAINDFIEHLAGMHNDVGSSISIKRTKKKWTITTKDGDGCKVIGSAETFAGAWFHEDEIGR